MYLQDSAKSRIVYFIRRGGKPLNKGSCYSLRREAHNGNAQMTSIRNNTRYINIHLCFETLMGGILDKILTVLTYLWGNTPKHIREILYFTWNTAEIQMAHFRWRMMSALTKLISRNLEELHRLSTHAICKNIFIFFRPIHFNYTDMSYLLPLLVRIWQTL
jgi:hypothetical protein